MTLNQAVFNIKNCPDRGTATRAQSISNRNIEHWIMTTYGFLMSKDIEKEMSYPVALEWDFGCIELQEVDQSECPDFLWGDTVKKAVFPPIMELKNNMGLAFFGLVDKRTRIYVPSSNYGSLDDFSRFKPKREKTGYMIGNDTVYIKGEGVEKLCVVNVRGAVKDPTLFTYNEANGNQQCFDKNLTQFPITSDMERVLYQMVWADYVMPFTKAVRQESNTEANEQLI